MDLPRRLPPFRVVRHRRYPKRRQRPLGDGLSIKHRRECLSSTYYLPVVGFESGRLDCRTDLQPHYARTLREWQRRFIDNFDVIGPAMMREHPEMTEEDVEVFKRKWICELASFCV